MKIKIQNLQICSFLAIFQINNLINCIFPIISSKSYEKEYFYLNGIEIFIYLILEIMLSLLHYFKRSFLQKTYDINQVLLNILMIILFSEFQCAKIFNLENKNFFDFAFILGVFMIMTLKLIKSKKIRLIVFILDMIYIISRFHIFSIIHVVRLFVFSIFFFAYHSWKFFKERKIESEKKEKKKTKDEYSLNPNSNWLKLLKQCMEEIDEGITIFDSEKKLLMNNDKIINILNCKANLDKKLLETKLKFSKINSNFEILKNDMQKNLKDSSLDCVSLKSIQGFTSFEEYFKNKSEFTLRETMQDLINYFENYYASPMKDIEAINNNRNKRINLISNLPRLHDDSEDEFYNLQFILTVFIEKNQIIYFFVHIRKFLDPDQLINNEKMNQNKKIFFVSHEMRTPLNCIVSMLQMIKPEINNELDKEFITPSIISCNFLLYLVQDLLDMAQIESEKFVINFEEFDIRAMIADIIHLFSFQLAAKNAKMLKMIANNIPETIISDHRRIRQILINLIGNALKFLPKLNGEITIIVAIDSEHLSEIIFSVKDNGIGIKEEDKDKLFRAFGKIHNEENKKLNSNGVGLGLMISNNLAMNLHPNKLEGLKVESKYGEGTSVRFVVEDKTELINLREHDSFRNLNENYQSLRKKDIGQIIFSNNRELKDIGPNLFSNTREAKENELKDLADSMKSENLKISEQYNFSSRKSLTSRHLMKQSKFLNQNNYSHSYKSFQIESSVQKVIISEDNTLFQSFCNVLLNNKNIETIEFFKNNIHLAKELIITKNCQCPQILLVDDNIFNLISLKKQLEPFGFRTISANDGEDAINMVKEFHISQKVVKCCKNFKIIFMDIEMPGINGYEASLAIKKYFELNQESFEGKIIGCSAHLAEEELGKHKKYGMNAFETKPIFKDKLIVLLGTYMKFHNNDSFSEKKISSRIN